MSRSSSTTSTLGAWAASPSVDIDGEGVDIVAQYATAAANRLATPAVEEGADAGDHALDLERLGDEKVSTGRRIVPAADCAHGDDAPQGPVRVAQPPDQAETVQARHHQVGDHHRR